MRKAELSVRILTLVHYSNCVNRESLTGLAREFHAPASRLRKELAAWRERRGLGKPETMRGWRKRMAGRFTTEALDEEDRERYEDGQRSKTGDDSATAQVSGLEGVGEVLPLDPPDNSPAFGDVRT